MSQFRAGIDVSKGTYNIIRGNSSGILIGTNTSTVNINSSQLNISSLNISFVTKYDGVEFSNNPTITTNSLDAAERSRHIPTTEWVNNYFDSKFAALNLQLNANIVPYGVNLLELKRIPFQTLPSSITPTLPDKTTRVSILILGPGGSAGANVSSLSDTNVSIGIGGAGGSGGAIYYPSIHCNFSKPFNINFSYKTDVNNNPIPLATIFSYSNEILSSTNVSLRNKIISIAFGGSNGEDTTDNLPGAQGSPGSGIIYYTYGQSVCQPGSLNISGNGAFYTGLKNVSKTLINYRGNNLLSYEIDNTILDNVGGSQRIVYDTNSVNISTINPGKGAVYMWCWNDSTTLQLNSSKAFNVSNGLGTQYNRINNESNTLSYRDTFTGPEKIFSITNVSNNCSIMYIDNIASNPLDFYTTSGYRFNASTTNMSIFPSNINPIKVRIGENATIINNSENTIQLGNESVVTRVHQLNALDASKKLMIGNLQNTGGISIGTETSIPNTVLMRATNNNLSRVLIDAKQINLSSTSVEVNSGGFETLLSDLSGNITIGSNGKIIRAKTIIYTDSNIVMGSGSSISIGGISIGNTSGSVTQNNNNLVATNIVVTGGLVRFINLLDNSNIPVFTVNQYGVVTGTSINVSNGGILNAFISETGLINGTTINVNNGGNITSSISSEGLITGTSLNVSNAGTINASISSAGAISGTSINVGNAGTINASISSAGAISGTSTTIYGPITVSNGGVNTASISSTGDIIGKSAVFKNAGTINASISSTGAISGTSINVSSGGVNTAFISSSGVISGTSIIFSTSGTVNASISSAGVITGTSINVSSGGVNTGSISSTGVITGTSAIIYGSINVSNGGSINVSNAGVTTASISSTGEIRGKTATINGLIIKNLLGEESVNISSNGTITGYNNVYIYGNITSSGDISAKGTLDAVNANISGSIVTGTPVNRIGDITSWGNIRANGNITVTANLLVPNIEPLSSTTNIIVGNTQTRGSIVIGNNTNGGISIGTDNVLENTMILNANNTSLNKMQLNASNMSINTDSAVFKVLKSLGLTANSNNILTLDTSGNTTLGHYSNVTMINSSLCLFNTSTLSLNSNGLNTIFSDSFGNVTVGNSVGTTNIMSFKQINFNTPIVTFNTPTINSTPKGLCITNSGIVSYASYQAPGVIIYCGESSSLNTTDFAQDPFCICSPSGGTNVSANSSGALSLGMGVDTNGRFGYINCAEFGIHRDIYLSSRGNASVYIGNPNSQIGSIPSNLYVNGQTTISGNTICFGTVSAGSDINLKKDIFTVENAIDKVKRLRGVNFTYIKNDEKSMGVIAQEIQEIIPEVVTNNNGTLTVNYGALAGIFIEAIKEMDVNHELVINELKDRITILEELFKKLI